MSVCITCQKSTDLVYSGVDAFLLQIRPDQIERICYGCANFQKSLAEESALFEEMEDKALRGLL